ncbi:hypothetical protein LTR37_009682 [Vermiconidia calcicola]|uniref:Uncharacterized protein n=1 Tax=Vermiconidia calcicola TaxID=1690605 RepID=A0ACC3N729_9PEZI|nr:hypothetical protein LTR37_009682 [Vermiconidia calcicola]
MSKVVKFLYDSDLDFAVRNTGTGSVSAKDAIISTHGFKDFSFDKQSETVSLGSGYDWGAVDKLMEEHALGYQVVGARCSWVGVSGSSLVGGLSWLSHEYGMISDPHNLLDMQIVLRDGRVLWASEEPDLMWALRGGGGNFGVVTALKTKARPYPTKVFAGIVLFPYSSLEEMSKVVSKMAARTADPRLAMHVVNRGAAFGEAPQGAKPGVAVMMWDAHGEAHARSDEGFGWVFKVPDCYELQAGEMSVREVNALAESFRHWQGRNQFWLCAPLLAEIDDETLVRAWKWWEDAINIFEGFQVGSTVLLEFMQEGAMTSSGGRDKTAWPHYERRHVMQLGLGCRPEGAPENIREVAMKQFQKAGPQIAGADKDTKEFHAGFLHEFNDLRDIYGENFDKLKELKKQYDPNNRFNKGVNLADEKVTAEMTV